jgi:hypothetical protein
MSETRTMETEVSVPGPSVDWMSASLRDDRSKSVSDLQSDSRLFLVSALILSLGS